MSSQSAITFSLSNRYLPELYRILHRVYFSVLTWRLPLQETRGFKGNYNNNYNFHGTDHCSANYNNNNHKATMARMANSSSKYSKDNHNHDSATHHNEEVLRLPEFLQRYEHVRIKFASQAWTSLTLKRITSKKTANYLLHYPTKINAQKLMKLMPWSAVYRRFQQM